jgi:hypothetical protein
MKSTLKALAIAALVAGVGTQATSNAADNVRKVTVLEDYAPDKMTTKIYELKNTKAADLTPLVANAVNYMDAESSVDRCNFSAEGKQLLVVSVRTDFVKYVDDMIQKLDKPGFLGRADYNFAYYMKYRSGGNLGAMLHSVYGDNMYETGESFYYEKEGYVIRWRDSKSDGEGFKKIIMQLDKPVPQVNLTFKVYEINDDDLKDIGVDYVSWMNGIDKTLAQFSYSSVRNHVADIFRDGSSNSSDFYFDWSFVRLMQQKGIAKTATSGYATIRNRKEAHISFAPTLQSLTKFDTQDDFVGNFTPEFKLDITDTMFYLNDTTDAAGQIDFKWKIVIDTPAGKTPKGDFIINTQELTSKEEMAAGQEKVLTSFIKEHDV